jgi:hypothetical protein
VLPKLSQSILDRCAQGSHPDAASSLDVLLGIKHSLVVASLALPGVPAGRNRL